MLVAVGECLGTGPQSNPGVARVQDIRLQSGEGIAHSQAVGGAGDLGVTAHPQGGNSAVGTVEIHRRHRDGAQGQHPGLGQQGHGLGAQVGGLSHVVPGLDGDDPAILVHPGLGVDDAALLDQVLGQVPIGQVGDGQALGPHRQDCGVNLGGVDLVGELQQVFRKGDALDIAQRVVRQIIQIGTVLLVAHQQVATQGGAAELVGDGGPGGGIVGI